MVAAPEISYAGAEFFNYRRGFVAERYRQRSGAITINSRKVRMANAGGGYTDKHFVRPRAAEFYLLYDQGA